MHAEAFRCRARSAERARTFHSRGGLRTAAGAMRTQTRCKAVHPPPYSTRSPAMVQGVADERHWARREEPAQ